MTTISIFYGESIDQAVNLNSTTARPLNGVVLF